MAPQVLFSGGLAQVRSPRWLPAWEQGSPTPPCQGPAGGAQVGILTLKYKEGVTRSNFRGNVLDRLSQSSGQPWEPPTPVSSIAKGRVCPPLSDPLQLRHRTQSLSQGRGERTSSAGLRGTPGRVLGLSGSGAAVTQDVVGEQRAAPLVTKAALQVSRVLLAAIPIPWSLLRGHRGLSLGHPHTHLSSPKLVFPTDRAA